MGLLIWIDLSSTLHRWVFGPALGSMEAPGNQRAARDLSSTVDPSDIRGLAITGHRSVGELPQSRFVRTRTEPGAHSSLEGSLRTVAAVTR